MKRRSSGRLFVISASFVLFFTVIGIGYAQWGSAITASSRLRTGGMDTVFLDCYISDAQGMAEAPEISADGKRLDIAISNAYPGYSCKIHYRIKNKGDIPVYCKLTDGGAGVAHVQLDIPDAVLDVDDNVEGTMTVTIPDWVQAGASYSQTFTLDYVQYNEMR